MPYGSPGAAASSALEDFMLQQEAQKRQAMLDKLAQSREDRLVKAELDAAQEKRDALQRLREKDAEQAHKDQVAELKGQTENLRQGDIPSYEMLQNATKLGQAEQLFPRPLESMPGVAAVPVGQVRLGVQQSSEPSVRPYIGTPQERTATQQDAATQQFEQGLPADSTERRAMEFERLTGKSAPAAMFPPRTAPPTSVQEFEYAQTHPGYEEYEKEAANLRRPTTPTTQPIQVFDEKGDAHFFQFSGGRFTEVPLPPPPEGTTWGSKTNPTTADMRNKAQARTLVGKSISALEQLGKEIITTVGPAQRADAIARGAEAVFGHDPKFRTYQDARLALAGNLAVAQQGSRPSDTDIKAIWLPLVPSAYSDTIESAKMKWDMIRTISNQTSEGGGSFHVISSRPVP